MFSCITLALKTAENSISLDSFPTNCSQYLSQHSSTFHNVLIHPVLTHDQHTMQLLLHADKSFVCKNQSSPNSHKFVSILIFVSPTPYSLYNWLFYQIKNHFYSHLRNLKEHFFSLSCKFSFSSTSLSVSVFKHIQTQSIECSKQTGCSESYFPPQSFLSLPLALLLAFYSQFVLQPIAV